MARPPKLSDDQLRAVIQEMRAMHPVLTGQALRQELLRRYGTRAGTQRVYRFLQAPPPPLPPAPVDGSPVQMAQLIAERDAALRRAELAEYREQATVDRTAYLIHDLREKLRRLGVDPFA
jgi:hypothetical protein